jgi:transglutaminase-like putative cysteine protease
MRFEVTHLTRYTYDKPVLLEPLLVRLRPRSDIFQRLVAFDLTVDPLPEGMSEMVDAEGNALSQIWFLGLAPMLALRTTFAVDTLRTNPFDYLVLDPDCLRMPMSYNNADHRALAHYLEPPDDPEVQAFAKEVLVASGGGATSFLGELSQRIASMTQQVRPTGDSMPAGQTLALRRGACRDMAVLFIETCRAVGVAARFVTGYEMSDPGTNERDLHAWAEVYLNGAGWRGYDPSQGLAVADRHVAVAAAAEPAEAAPTLGSYRGTNVAATMDTMITVKVPTYAENAYQPSGRPPLARVVGLPPHAG